jgi:hypothetical protein
MASRGSVGRTVPDMAPQEGNCKYNLTDPRRKTHFEEKRLKLSVIEDS